MLDGCWTITENLFKTACHLLPSIQYPKLLEIGSGKGTEDWRDAGYQVTTVEDDPEWVGKTDGVVSLHAPLVNRWYDTSIMQSTVLLPGFDIWLIDGPKGSKGDRTRILGYITTKNMPRAFIVDDTHRPDGTNIVAGLMTLCQQKGIIPKVVTMAGNTTPGGPRHEGMLIVL